MTKRRFPTDLETTFNYLIGLRVETRRVYAYPDRRYVVLTGPMEHEQSIGTVVGGRNRDSVQPHAGHPCTDPIEKPDGERAASSGVVVS